MRSAWKKLSETECAGYTNDHISAKTKEKCSIDLANERQVIPLCRSNPEALLDVLVAASIGRDLRHGTKLQV